MRRTTFLKSALALPLLAVRDPDEPLPFNDPDLVRDLMGGPLHGVSIGGRTNRGPNMLRACIEGMVEMRARQNTEPCQCCKGQWRHVYRYTTPMWKDHDPDQWFCVCGWTEWPTVSWDDWPGLMTRKYVTGP